MVITHKRKVLVHLSTIKKINDVIKILLAGVFNPLKWSCCVSSMLKTAKRRAEHTAIRKAKYGSHSWADTAAIILYITSDGNNPKLTISASESSSLPMADD